MAKKIFLIMGLLFLMPVVFASTTTINVKTLPNHDVEVTVLDPFPNEGQKNLLESFDDKDSGDSGEFSVETHVSKSTINIRVILKKNGERVEVNGKTVHLFEKKPTGGVINLEVKEDSGEEQPVVGEVEEESDVVGETEVDMEIEVAEETESDEIQEEVIEDEIVEEIEQNKSSGKITGFIVNGGKAVVSSKVTYYIIGGIFVIGILFFVVAVGRKKLRSKGGIKIRKMSEDGYEKRLDDAERRLNEAKEELDDLRNRRNRLKEAQERFEKDQEELRNLEKD